MLRQIIVIDEKKCDGCGDCVHSCMEGALQLIDGKAKLISELFCDGLGACIGNCPQHAISVVEKEALPYNEERTLENIIPQGKKVIEAHLLHLQKHGQTIYFNTAMQYLAGRGIQIELPEPNPPRSTIPLNLEKNETVQERTACGCSGQESELMNWPIQLHLINPMNDSYAGKDLLIAADCVPFALRNFHDILLKDHSVVIACPKLDTNKEAYVQKLTMMFTHNQINSITVAVMEVPCCGGLVRLVKQALDASNQNIPFFYKVIGIEGAILN